ncbi:DNA methyltransferase [Xanthomonas cannabis]|uniref:DNA methyltransferase n=1 Tax=Xanthomonas cannabis TaxID=1885674 RepID=UPI0009DD9B92
MKIAEIGESVRQLVLAPDQDRFLFDLLLAYGQPKASITRLESKDKGSYNLSTIDGAVLWKKKVLYATTPLDDVENYAQVLIASQATEKHAPRFVIVTNFDRLYALDTKTHEKLDILFVELPKHFDFFLPWANMEKATVTPDNPADVKAAEKMAKLFDLIKADNPSTDPKAIHSLNVFLSRLLFCYFAEDTGIFKDKLFTNKIQSQTSKDGSDVQEYLDQLFKALNTEDRKEIPDYLGDFPYVNGGLFADIHPSPAFRAKSRAILIECGAELDWSEINPDIFGSMIQAVVDVKHRSSMGMHYTSFDNIMKVIEPLFLFELYASFEANKENPKKLHELLARIRKIKIFDPACGSGNFLIIAYKEIRKLEMEIFNQIATHTKQSDLGLSGIQLSQFYGIELDDFAHEVATLAMWLAEHQMNLAFVKRFGKFMPTLPLKPSGKFVHANALRKEWTEVCDPTNCEVYIVGNPPYLGARNQDEHQKADLALVFENSEDYKDSDYVSGWLLKAAEYIQGQNARFAFVTTNSISQGEQVSYLWPRLWRRDLEIFFARQGFKWGNSAKKNAGVTCVIAGVRNSCREPKYIHTNGLITRVQNINGYLTEGKNITVARTKERISDLPLMMIGSMARDGGNLIMSDGEMRAIVDAHPESTPLFKRLTGTNEFIKGTSRWCLWIEDEDRNLAESIRPIRDRIAAVRSFRNDSKAKTTNEYAKIPHKFAQRLYEERDSIVVPSTTSERRKYIPIGYMSPGVVITNSANAIYDASPFVFGIISSLMHMVWVRAIGGQLETRLRYSAEICYNTFPLRLTDKSKIQAITECALKLLSVREFHSDKSIEVLYDPDTMPLELVRAHDLLDKAVDSAYRSKPFVDDEERLEHLLATYEQMTGTADA